MNRLWAILPVKPFGEGKSRLASRLLARERGQLSKELLTRAIQTIQAAGVCTEILVISRDADVLTYANSLGSLTVEEAPTLPHEDSLNAALYQAVGEAVAQRADAILVLPADLPLITSADIVDLANAGRKAPQVVLAPSTDSGTNALLLNPPGLIDFAFGVKSFDAHRASAQANHIPLQIIHSPTLAFDVDRPADLDVLARLAAV